MGCTQISLPTVDYREPVAILLSAERSFIKKKVKFWPSIKSIPKLK
jgi:hypothetical protein